MKKITDMLRFKFASDKAQTPPQAVPDQALLPLAADVQVEPADLPALLPIDPSDSEQPRVNARHLHKFLEIGKDFSTWIKDRIETVGFVENEDFTVDSPNLGNQSGRGGDRRSREYWLTMDMAKELSMLERNARGRQARRYFIECEKQLRQVARQALDMSDPLVTARLFIEAEECRRAALLENARVKVDLQVAEIKNEALTQKLVAQAEQVELLSDKLASNAESVLIESFARSTADVLGYGRTDLFAYLRRKGFLLRRPRNDPSAEMISAGYFVKELNVAYVDHKNDAVRNSTTTKLTPTGAKWLLKYMSRDDDTALRRMLASRKYDYTNLGCLRGYELYKDGSAIARELGENDRKRAILYSSHATTRAGIKSWTVSRQGLLGVDIGTGSTIYEALVNLANQNKKVSTHS